MPTQCKPLSFAFQGCQGRRVAAAFDGGAITSNAGVLLLREIDRSVGLLDQVAGCFTDYRDPRLTEHSVGTLVRQRVMGITLGYEDLNDHDTKTSTTTTSCGTTLFWRCSPASSMDIGRTVRRWRGRAP